MPRYRPQIVVLWFLLLPIASSPARTGAQEEASSWSLERFHWSAELSEGKTVRIENLHGDLRVRHAGNREVEVSAVIQKDVRDSLEAHIEVHETDEGLSIKAVYRPRGNPATEEADDPEEADLVRRVDLVVFLPAGNPLVARTGRGLLEAKGLQSSVEGTTTFGDIVVSTDQRIALRSQHGAISVVLKTTAWQEPALLETLTGDIRVELPKGADVLATATTTGEITTDFSIAIERPEHGFHKRAKATIGKGTCPLQIVTEKGGIKLVETAF